MKVPHALQVIEEIDNTLDNLNKLHQLNRETKVLDQAVADADCNNTWVNILAKIQMSMIKHKSYLKSQIDDADIQDL